MAEHDPDELPRDPDWEHVPAGLEGWTGSR